MTTLVSRRTEALITAPRDANDWDAFDAVARRAFGDARHDSRLLRPHVVARLATVDNEVVGGAMAFRAQQFFGRQPVPGCCIATVCVAPEWRGRGIAGRIIEALIGQMTRDGAVLSALWTPAVGVYRRWGWEIGGLARCYSLPIAALRSMPEGAGEIRRGAAAGLCAFQRRLAEDWDGPIERPEWWWDWKYPRDGRGPWLSHVIDGDDRLRGILGYREKRVKPWGYDLIVSDFWARDRSAARTLCRYLLDHGSQARRVTFQQNVLPGTPFMLWELPHHDLRDQGWYPWMLRVLDVPAALTHRGWPEIDARLDLEIMDGATGPRRFVFECSRGKASVAEGGSGLVKLSLGHLASWYAGALDRDALRRLASSAVPESIIALMDTLTRGPSPWLPDIF
jgi:predicted acetyltransferase